jgi:nucleoside-diphosphate-sugar epimerase
MLTRVNSEATEALAREAIRAGVRTVVFLSSVSVYGGRGGVLTEDTEGEALDAYGESKRTAERALVALAKEIRIRIVRLPGVLGPRAETPWLTKVAQAFLEQRRVTFSRPNEPFNHAIGDGDVARWVLKAAEEISSEPWVHNLAAGEPMMLRDALLLLRSSLGSFSALEEVEPTKAHALIDVERACCALGELPTLRDVLSNYASEVLATRG